MIVEYQHCKTCDRTRWYVVTEEPDAGLCLMCIERQFRAFLKQYGGRRTPDRTDVASHFVGG